MRNEIFEDYSGATIAFTAERREHVLQHAEMTGLLKEIPEVLREPALVRQSVADSSVRLYYRPVETLVFGEMWLCVVVKWGETDSFILTAYLTNKPKKGNRIWRAT